MNTGNQPTAAPNSPPIHAAQLRFGSFDAFAEATRGWDLDWRQLDRGRLNANLIRVASPGASIFRVAFDRSFLSDHGNADSTSPLQWWREALQHPWGLRLPRALKSEDELRRTILIFVHIDGVQIFEASGQPSEMYCFSWSSRFTYGQPFTTKHMFAFLPVWRMAKDSNDCIVKFLRECIYILRTGKRLHEFRGKPMPGGGQDYAQGWF